MSVSKKRITSIETSLTPKQAVLLWLKKAQRDGSFVAYLGREVQECKSHRSPDEMLDRVREAVLRAMKGQDKATVARALTHALRDTYFLRELVHQANQAVFREQEVHVWCSTHLLWRAELYLLTCDEQRSLLEFVQKGSCPVDVTTATAGEAEVVGVRVEKNGSGTAHSDFVTVASPSEAVAEQRRRNEMIRELRAWLANPFEEGGPTNDRQVPVGRLDAFPRIRIGDWWERAVAHAHNVLVSGVAIEAIAKRFFDGHPVLFKDLADSLRDDVSLAELVIEHCNTLAAFRSESDRMKDEAKGEKPHNDDLKNLFPCLCPIDLGQLKEVAQAPAAAMVEQFVGRAKAETLSAWGERRAALDPLMKLAPAV